MAEDDESFRTFGDQILRALTIHNIDPLKVSPIPLHYYKDKLPLRAAIENIGSETCARLVAKLLKRRFTDLSPHYVSVGLSGAAVLRVDCELAVTEEQPPESRSLLLKASRDELQMRLELAKNADTAAFPEGLFVPLTSSYLEGVNGWWGLSYSYVPDARTMLDWITSGAPGKALLPPATIERALRILFVGPSGLSLVYNRQRLVEREKATKRIWSDLLSSRRAKILAALDELGRLVEKYSGYSEFHRGVIENFLEDHTLPSAPDRQIIPGVRICRTHGDLHLRNVLIDSNENPRLIDPANIGSTHWANDVCRFLADLVVSGYARGDRSQEWSEVASWLEIVRRIAKGPTLNIADYSDDDQGVIVAINWIRANLATLVAANNWTKQHHWEFELSLACEFLRAGYRAQELPGPKRVLGLACGCMLLNEITPG